MLTMRSALLALCLGLVVTGVVANRPAGPPASPPEGSYTALADIPDPAPLPRPGPDAATGSLSVDCGRNERGHRNTDNVVVSPGLVGGAHHTHDYVGNVSTDALSTDRSLAAAATTCAGGDRSAYYWPVLRRLDRHGPDADAHGGGRHGNTGEILVPSAVRVEFHGSPVSQVLVPPKGLRMITGDPVAATTDRGLARAQWGCSGHPERFTTDYPTCPAGSGVTRTFDFPSCWNGLHTDSPDHRSHIVFPLADGGCPRATFPVPRLRLTLTYDIPAGVRFAVDSFPEQRRAPVTDHAMFIGVLSDARRAALTDCVNEGRRCRAVRPGAPGASG
ncbi:DUF1996 domain-containing protein [Streptomyces uncialis]|uniref:DUF1996 domain-containing protein n=1 Tax=Streptomyces uncialis TaxID=1048205 RepID=UPI002E344BA4|nr:DUF1996 domain-containing protein [Streptomyces uncialis]